MRGVRFVAFGVPHPLGVAVVGGHDQRAARAADGGGDAGQAAVEGRDGAGRRVQVARVPHHVGVGEVADDHVVAAVLHVVDERVGEAGRAHLRLQVVGRDLRRRHQDAVLPRVRPFLAAVEEIGDVGVLLGLRQAQVGAAGRRQDLRHVARERRRVEGHGQTEGGVVLGQRRDRGGGAARALEGVEPALVEGQGPGQLPRPVRAEVEEHDGVAVAQRADRLPAAVHHHARFDELVRRARGVGGGDERAGVRGAAPGAPGQRGPGAPRAVPAPVAVHRVVAADDRRDASRARVRQHALDRGHVVGRGGGRGVASVGERVDEQPRHLPPPRHLDQRGQMPEMAVHAPPRDQAQQVQGASAAGAAIHGRGQRRVREEVALADAPVDAGQVLIDHAARAEVHVADLGVAHLARRQADRFAAGHERRVRVALQELGVRGRAAQRDRVVAAFGAQAPAVEDDEDRGRAAGGGHGRRRAKAA